MHFQNTICACLAYWMIPSPTRRCWRLNDPFCSHAAATVAAKIANAYECPDNPTNCPLSLGDLDPHVVHGSMAHRSVHSKRHVDRFSRFCTTHRSVLLLYHGPLRFPPKLPLPLSGSGLPTETWYLWPARVTQPNAISICSAVFVWVSNAMLHSAFSVGKKTPKIASSSWDCVTLTEEDRATAMGNMQEKFGKDRACGSGDMLSDRHTDTQTDRNTHRRAHCNTSLLKSFYILICYFLRFQLFYFANVFISKNFVEVACIIQREALSKNSNKIIFFFCKSVNLNNHTELLITCTWSHADVERFAYQSKQRGTKMNRFVCGDRHVHAN